MFGFVGPCNFGQEFRFYLNGNMKPLNMFKTRFCFKNLTLTAEVWTGRDAVGAGSSFRRNG